MTGTFRVAALEDTFALETSAPSADNAKLEGIKNSFSAPDYNSALEVKRKSGETTFFFAEPQNVFAQDLNSFLSDYNGLLANSFTMHFGNDNPVSSQAYVTDVAVVVEDQNNYSAFVSGLDSELNALGFRVKSIKSPQVSLVGMVTVLSGGREKLLADVAEAQNANKATFEILQKGRIDTNSIFIADQNTDFVLPGGSFISLVKPTHSAGDDVNLALTLVGSKRGGVMQIMNAQEEEGQNS